MSGRPNCLSFVCSLSLNWQLGRAGSPRWLFLHVWSEQYLARYPDIHINARITHPLYMLDDINPAKEWIWSNWTHLKSISEQRYKDSYPPFDFFQNCINFSIMAGSQQKSTKLNYADEWWTGQWFIIPHEKPTKAGPFRFVQVTNDC